jgi:hypothetical protein
VDGPPISISIDFSALAALIWNAFLDGTKAVLEPTPGQLEQWLLRSIQQILAAQGGHNLLTHVPVEWTSQNPEVLNLYRQLLPAQLGLMAVVLCIQGFRVTRAQVDLFDAVFGSGFYLILGLTTAIWADKAIVAVNAASDFVSTSPLDIRAETLPSDLVLGLLLIVAAILAAFAWLKGAVGVVFIDFLIVFAPFALTLSALPLFGGLSKWLAEEFTTWLLRPFAVAIVLRLGLGLVGTDSGGIQLLFACVTFWLAYTMDTRIRRFSVGAWGSLGNLNVLSRGAALAAGYASGGAGAVASMGRATAGAAGGAMAAYDARLHS